MIGPTEIIRIEGISPQNVCIPLTLNRGLTFDCTVSLNWFSKLKGLDWLYFSTNQTVSTRMGLLWYLPRLILDTVLQLLLLGYDIYSGDICG